MKKSLLFILLTLYLVGCSNKNVSDTDIQTADNLTSLESNEELDSYDVNREILINDNIYITDIVLDLKKYYEVYKDFGIKHGMLYTNGEFTYKSPVMFEIDGYVYGVDDIEKDELVYEYYDDELIEVFTLEIDEIYNNFLTMEIDDIISDLMWICDYDDDWIPSDDTMDVYTKYFVSDLGYYGYDYADKTEENGYISMETFESMDDESKRLHLAKVSVQIYESENNLISELNKEIEERNGTVKSVSRKLPDDSPEYKEWYLENENMIMMAELIDFTKEKEIPDYITEDNGEYYITLENLRTLWEEQGCPEDKVVSMCVYGLEFDYDVSNYNFE